MFSHLAQKEYKQGVVIDKKGITFFMYVILKCFEKKIKNSFTQYTKNNQYQL